MWVPRAKKSKNRFFGNRFGGPQGVCFGSRGAHLAYLPHISATACHFGLKTRKIGFQQVAAYGFKSNFDVIIFCDFRVEMAGNRLPIIYI